jgi:adenylosuccinate lyase
MLVRFEAVVDRLVVKPERMLRNLELTGGLIHSQRILLELVRAGASRERGYARVQALAFEAMEGGRTFRELCLEDPELLDLLGRERLEACFDLGYHLAQVDAIFERVFGAQG